MTQLRYTLSGHDRAELAAEIDRFWSELAKPGSRLAATAAESGLDVAALQSSKHRLRLESEGMGLADEAVLIGIATVALRDLWTKVILPYLVRRWGKGTITPRRPRSGGKKKTPQGKGATPPRRLRSGSKKKTPPGRAKRPKKKKPSSA